MDVIELIFKLVLAWVPIDDGEYAKMKEKADKWKSEQTENSDSQVGRLYAKHGRKWGVMLLAACMYIPMYKMIGEYMHNFNIGDEEEVED